MDGGSDSAAMKMAPKGCLHGRIIEEAMATTTTGQAPEETQEFTTIFWNGEPFELLEKPHRTSHIVRTKRVSPELRRRYGRDGWPRELVINREHSLKLTGEEVLLKILTNAEEAEDELPEEILTPRRDTGTFRDALVTWRGRTVKSFVSARLRAKTAATPSADHPAAHFTPAILNSIQHTLQSGIIVRNAPLPAALTPDDRMLVNLLTAAHQGKDGVCLSFREIGAILNVSDETVRRRRITLEELYPTTKRLIASFRTRNGVPATPDDIMLPRREDPVDDEE
jgi:hypothetical protein